MNNGRGFTLIELIVGITLIVIVMSAAYAGFRSGMDMYRYQEKQNVFHQNIRQALFLVSRDMRCAYMPASRTDISFIGMHRADMFEAGDQVAFVTCLPSAHSKSGGLAGVAYYVSADPLIAQKGLVRSNSGFPAGPPEISKADIVEVAPLVKTMKLRYYDGDEWLDEWGSSNSAKSQALSHTLPAAVEISMTVHEHENSSGTETFTTVVPLYASKVLP